MTQESRTLLLIILAVAIAFLIILCVALAMFLYRQEPPPPPEDCALLGAADVSVRGCGGGQRRRDPERRTDVSPGGERER